MEKLNLQLFAENPDTGSAEENQSQEPTPITQVDVDAAVEAALAKAQVKWAEDTQKQIQAAEEKATMTADERAKAEFEEEKAKLEADRAIFHRQKIELAVVKELSKENLSPAFAGFLIAEDEEKSLANIKTLKEAFDKAVEAAVGERLKGSEPKRGTTTNTVTKEEFEKMSYAQRAELANSNPELYRQLAQK
ncbi:MAG: DUF4355 domain-containing protein [Peptostreptococcaceae bacterium]|nr:DUF4355 domain-containing protein [Peptostreptococcaceae bacterium]